MKIQNVKGLSFHRHRDPARSSVVFSYIEPDGEWVEIQIPLVDALSMLNTLRHLEADQGLQELTRAAAAISSMEFAPPDLPVPPDTRVKIPSAVLRSSANDAMLDRCYERVLRNELAVAVGAWASEPSLTIPAVGRRFNSELELGFNEWGEHDFFENWNDFASAVEAKLGFVKFREMMRELFDNAQPSPHARLVAALPVSNFIDLTLDRSVAKAMRVIGKQPIEHGPLSGMMGSWKQTDSTRPNIFYALEYPLGGGQGFGGVRSRLLEDNLLRANADEMLRRKDLLLLALTPHEAEYILHLHLFATSGEKIVNCAPNDQDPSYWARRGVYISSVEPVTFLRSLLPADGEAFGMLDAIVPARMVIDIHRRRSQAFLSHSRRDSAFVDWLASMFRLRGISYWRDQREMEVGDPVIETIRDALSDVYCFVLVLSPDALRSQWVATEIREALTLSEAGELRIVPILIADCEIPPELARFDYADFRQGKVESELDRLVRSIRTGADRLEGKA